MICFEEFDTHIRYPVVLPCGHTYVCAECAKRLDRCMECRKSVFAPSQPVPGQDRGPVAPSTTMRSSGRVLRTQNQGRNYRQPKVAKTRLPLPKNVVLLSLMNSTEMTIQEADENCSYLQTDSCEEKNEENKIKMSTEIATGACGTYVVASKMGLEIVTTKPQPAKSKDFTNKWESSVDNMIIQSSGSSMASKSSEEYLRNEAHLSYGDRSVVCLIKTQ